MTPEMTFPQWRFLLRISVYLLATDEGVDSQGVGMMGLNKSSSLLRR
jgi:hypothetical protein